MECHERAAIATHESHAACGNGSSTVLNMQSMAPLFKGYPALVSTWSRGERKAAA